MHFALTQQPDTMLLGAPSRGFLPRSFGLWMAATYVGLFIIRPWERLIPELGPLHFERWFAILVIASVAVTCGFRFHFNMQNFSVAALTGAMGLSYVMAQNVVAAWTPFYVYLTLIVCYVILVSVIRTPHDLLFIVGAYIGFMELYLGKALWEFFVHGGGKHAAGVLRLTGIEYTFGDVNRLAGSIVISLPVWLFLWRCRRDILAGWPAGWRRCIVGGLAVYPVLGVVSVVLTNSRTGMVNLCVFVLLVRLQKKSVFQWLPNLLIASLILVAGWFAMPEEHQNRFRTVWDPASGSVSARESAEGRYLGFLDGVAMFERHPLTGVGPGNFGLYRAQYLGGTAHIAHNFCGEILGELGALGVFAFAFFVIVILTGCRKTRILGRAAVDVNLRVLAELAIACRFSVILLFVEGLGLHNLYRFNWLWLAAFSMLAAQFASRISSEAGTGQTHGPPPYYT